jgi:hypothetical protein
VGIVSALIYAMNFVIGRLLPGADRFALFLVFEVINLLVFLFARRVMGRIEGRSIADYGLPWRGRFRAQFWQGAVLGFACVTGLLVAMRAPGVFQFGSQALHGVYI